MIFQDKTLAGEEKSYPWIRAINPNQEEINKLSQDYHLDASLIIDALDPDELARYETLADNKGRLVIVRLPYTQPGQDFMHTTMTFSFFLLDSEGILLTVCKENIPMFDRALFNQNILYVPNLECFLLKVLFYAGMEYLRYLKEIKSLTDTLETQLEHVVHNKEVIKLWRIEKSLQYFKTSLRSNEMLMAKVQKSPTWDLSPTEKELLKDATIEMSEAVEITQIYLNTLHSMTDAFASVINNDLNIAMKRLTVISVIMMLPTVVASFFGMNIPLPVPLTTRAFWCVVGTSIGTSLIMISLLRLKKFF